jgi:hypothetical protein
MIILKVLKHVMRLAYIILLYAYIIMYFKILFLPFNIGVIIDNLLLSMYNEFVME